MRCFRIGCGAATRKAREEVKSTIWLKCPSKLDRYFHWITVTPAEAAFAE